MNGHPEGRTGLVSIGMPVYNAERYLREALDSLTGQDYRSIEVIVSDNASTDATPRICEEYAARDPRIRYQRAERNLGAVWNFNRVFELARGEYFMWAAFDDLREPSYVRRCVEALESHPNAVLCCTNIRIIDEAGRVAEGGRVGRVIHPVGRSRAERLRALAGANFWSDIYGLIRLRALATTRLAQPVWGFDVLLLLELCLRDEVILVPEELFSYRVFREKAQEDLAVGLASTADGQPIPVSWSNLALEMARSITLAPISRREKLALTRLFLTRFCLMNHTVRGYIRRDVAKTLRAALRAHRYRRALALLGLAAAIYPIQHRLGKAVYQRIHHLRHSRTASNPGAQRSG